MSKPMTDTQHGRMIDVLLEVGRERHRQHRTHGEQTRADGIFPDDEALVEHLLDGCRLEQTGEDGAPWGYVLLEEACEAALERDPVKLRAELVQVAAVAVQWIEALDRRKALPEPTQADRDFIASVAGTPQAKQAAASGPIWSGREVRIDPEPFAPPAGSQTAKRGAA